MFQGNSDLTLITIFLIASRHKGKSPAQILKTPKIDFYRRLVIPSRTFLRFLWKSISRLVLTSWRSSVTRCEHRHLNSRSADFELLVTYPAVPNPVRVHQPRNRI